MFEIEPWVLSFMIYSLVWIVVQWFGFAYFWGVNTLGYIRIQTRERAALYMFINISVLFALILVAMRFG